MLSVHNLIIKANCSECTDFCLQLEKGKTTITKPFTFSKWKHISKKNHILKIKPLSKTHFEIGNMLIWKTKFIIFVTTFDYLYFLIWLLLCYFENDEQITCLTTKLIYSFVLFLEKPITKFGWLACIGNWKRMHFSLIQWIEWLCGLACWARWYIVDFSLEKWLRTVEIWWCMALVKAYFTVVPQL